MSIVASSPSAPFAHSKTTSLQDYVPPTPTYR
jgi:hypothetical protein